MEIVITVVGVIAMIALTVVLKSKKRPTKIFKIR